MAFPTDIGHQVTRVLRLRAGERVALFCGDGSECEAVLETAASGHVTAHIVERRTPDVELPCELHVGMAVLKGEKLEWAVQKLTELGVSRISFLATERTVVTAESERWSKRLERYRRIAREAAEQCGRVRVPEIHEPVGIAAAIEASGEAARLFLDPRSSRTALELLRPCPAKVLALIGPEGGFTETEAAAAREAGASAVGLGPRVLRAETAALAVAVLAAAAAEELP